MPLTSVLDYAILDDMILDYLPDPIPTFEVICNVVKEVDLICNVDREINIICNVVREVNV